MRISRRAIAADLDLLARAWHWSEEDVVVQGTPLFRAYGLVVGLLGALRAGSRFVHLDDAGTAGPVGSVHLASPDQWARIALDGHRARPLSAARILVSADGPLARAVAERLRLLTSHRPVQAYGTTETLVALTGRAGDRTVPGAVGTPARRRDARAGPRGPAGAGRRPVGGRAERLRADAVQRVRRRAEPRRRSLARHRGPGQRGPRRHVPDHRAVRARRGAQPGPADARRADRGGVAEPTGVRDAAVVGTPHHALGEQVTAYVVAEG
ncbi:AMP-binding protein [Micromonospora sp. BRA006-A]|nr:AMP-binding protein [Micromonospora sp. BRA006-A]